MSRMNFNLNLENPRKGNKFPWFMVIVVALVAGVMAWMLEPTIVHAWRLG